VVSRHEFNLTSVTVILTVVGYSVNDTIVIYDRIRENAKKHKGRVLRDIVNLSINEMLGRTILTSGATALSLVGLLVYGVGTIWDFAAAMLVGIISGTYSTWYIASPMTIWLEEHAEQRKAIAAAHRRRRSRTARPTTRSRTAPAGGGRPIKNRLVVRARANKHECAGSSGKGQGGTPCSRARGSLRCSAFHLPSAACSGPGVSRAVAGGALPRAPLRALAQSVRAEGDRGGVSRLQRALAQGERVCVYGDYDVDGVTSTALLVSVLRKLGGNVEFYFRTGWWKGMAERPGAGEARRARDPAGGERRLRSDGGGRDRRSREAGARRGGDRSPHASQDLPRAVAILNPHQPGCTFPGRELAAVGVAFHLLLALRKRLREAGWFASRPEPNLREVLDLWRWAPSPTWCR